MEVVASDLRQADVLPQPQISPRRNVWPWAEMIGVALVVAGGLMIGQGGALRWAFPATALVVGIYLYWKRPVHYITFMWWVWFASPFIRRLVDYQSGWVDPSPVLLAPVLVSLVAGIGFLRRLLPALREGGLPFALAFAGVLYGLGVGLIRTSFDYTLAQPMMAWLVPLFIGFHLFINWRDYPQYRQALQQTFVIGALVMGIYGVAQFLTAPAWDRFWMTNIEFGSFGKPLPFAVRVFSTLNAPGPFAAVMMAALLTLFGARGWVRVPAAVGGYLSFLLSMARSSWIGWTAGLIVLLAGMRLRARLKLLAVIIALGAVIVPLATLPPFGTVVKPRLESLLNSEEDASLAARMDGYGRYLRDAAGDPLGKGIGVMDREYAIAADDEGIGPHDSAILELLLSLGFPGAAMYCAGLMALLFGLRSRPASQSDAFVNTARAVGIGMFVQLILGSVMLGVMGVVLWSFTGVALAARKYYGALEAESAAG